jgi:hypothetical protein
MINRKKLQREKKAELTTQQIVILTILIVSFIIILLFIFLLKPGDIADKEICHNSVVMRGNSVLPEDAIPLDCKTSYICITEDGSCERMTNPKIVKVKEKEEVYEVLAENMADCWWMFGEGGIDYVGKEWINKNLYCSICSQIAFDNSVIDVFGFETVDKKEYYNYLALTEMSDKGLTYLEYLNAVSDMSEIHQGEFGEIDLNSQYYVMMGIKSEISAWRNVIIGAAGVGVLAAVIVAAPISGPALALFSVKGVIITGIGAGVGAGAGAYVGTLGEGDSGNEFLLPTLIEVNSEIFKSLDEACDEIVTLA